VTTFLTNGCPDWPAGRGEEKNTRWWARGGGTGRRSVVKLDEYTFTGTSVATEKKREGKNIARGWKFTRGDRGGGVPETNMLFWNNKEKPQKGVDCETGGLGVETRRIKAGEGEEYVFGKELRGVATCQSRNDHRGGMEKECVTSPLR